MAAQASVTSLVGTMAGFVGVTAAAVWAREAFLAGPEHETKKNAVFQLRESRKLGRNEMVNFQLESANGEHKPYEGENYGGNYQKNERMHHMRTSQSTLRRQSSRNPNIKRSPSGKRVIVEAE